MPVYNKLKIAILAIITTPTVHAITLDPIEVQSGAGNLLYAEMKFRNADPNARVEASLVDSKDLIHLGTGHQPPGHLNFFTRKSGDGSGVIVITSSRPVVDPELNILLKIKEGDATHIKQIKTRLNRSNRAPEKPQLSTKETALIPQTVVSEKDIALNLPTSSQYTTQHPPALQTVVQPSNTSTAMSAQSSSNIPNAMPLAINVAPVPALNTPAPTSTAKVSTPVTAATITAPTLKSEASPAQPSLGLAQPMMTTLTISETIRPASEPSAVKPHNNAPELAKKTVSPVSEKQAQEQQVQQKAPREVPQSAKASNVSSSQSQHVVQANESLWKIASRIAAKTNQSIPDVMQQIKANNQHAFIGGDINRIRRGVALNMAMTQQTTVKKAYKPKAQSTSPNQKQSGKEKYKLNQAEMTLVAENKQDSAQGSAKQKSSVNQTTPELSAKVMTARQKTVKLQQNVSQLSAAIQQKDQRIQVLNARLAQLQQELQKKNQANKTAH